MEISLLLLMLITLMNLQNVPGSDYPTLSVTGLTCVEATSNGNTAFKHPKSRNAAATLVWDGALLMVMFLGLCIVGYLVQAHPSEQEVLISRVARTIYGDDIMRFLTLLPTS